MPFQRRAVSELCNPLARTVLRSLSGSGWWAPVQTSVFAPMQETVRWQASKYWPVPSGGGGGASSRSSRLSRRASHPVAGGARGGIEQKQSIVPAAFEPGAVVREVAGQCDVTASLIYRWRRDLQAAANGFARVVVAPAGDGITAPPSIPAIEIEFPGGARVRIPASVSPALAAAVVAALARR